MSDTPRTDAMMESIEIEEIKLIAGGNQATFSSYAMESITELARDFERENAELRKKLEWREIETAPKDGASILLYSPDGGCCQGYWFDGRDDTGWCTDDGLFSNDWTHWMPLSEPPK